MSDENLRLDGNAAAGMLAAIFPFEMTSAQMTSARSICASCGHGGPLGSLLLYGGIMGAILRCPACDHVQLRMAHVRGHYMIDMRGMTALQIATA